MGAVARRALGTTGRPARDRPVGAAAAARPRTNSQARGRRRGAASHQLAGACSHRRAPLRLGPFALGPGHPCRSRCSLATKSPGALTHRRLVALGHSHGGGRVPARCARPPPRRRPPHAFHTAGRPCAWCTTGQRPPRGRPSPHSGACPLDTKETTQAFFKIRRVFLKYFFEKPGAENPKFSLELFSKSIDTPLKIWYNEDRKRAQTLAKFTLKNTESRGFRYEHYSI